MFNKLIKNSLVFLFFIFYFFNQLEASSTYSIAKANRIGKSYAYKIKERVNNYEIFPSAIVCKRFILQDIQSNNNHRYFHSNYLIKHYNKDFVLRTFKSCIISLNLIKSISIKKKLL